MLNRRTLLGPIVMKYKTFNHQQFFAACVFCLVSFAGIVSGFAQQPQKNIVIKNNSSKAVNDYTLEIPARNLNLPIGTYVARVGGETVPVEVARDIFGIQTVIMPISHIDAGMQMDIMIEQGTSEMYPKRSHAELSHKIGGQFEGNKYTGGYSWVRVNDMTLPGNFRDHAYYIKYEGPGWESDKVAFRFYLDNRNAIDVFGKKTSDIVLPAVGIDGYDNYHKPADWGMDNMKVGKALGIGTIAIWDGQKAQRVEKRDSTTCIIQSDGKIRSQVKTIYHGWDANGVKCNLISLISIDAGSRASYMQLVTDRQTENIATGIIKSKDAELITGNDKGNEWSYIATFGKQSLNNDMQGLAVFFRTKQLKQITEDELNHVLVLTPENNYTEYYFMPTWELDKEPVKTKEQFMECINEVLDRLNSKISINIKK